MTRTVVMILATNKDGVIGYRKPDNTMTIPWQCSTDLKFFKRCTVGNVVIMGRATFESLNSKPLPNRLNIVVSSSLDSDGNLDYPNLAIVPKFTDAIKFAKVCDLSKYESHRETVNEHIFIAGGASIYKESVKLIDEYIHSLIDVDLDVDEPGWVMFKDIFDIAYRKPNDYGFIFRDDYSVANTSDKNVLHYIEHGVINSSDGTFQLKNFRSIKDVCEKTNKMFIK